MKKLIVTCSLVVAASAVSFGQSVQSSNPAARPGTVQNKAAGQTITPDAVADRQAKAYKAKLNLTPEQYKGVYDAELNYAKQKQYFQDQKVEIGAGQAAQMEMGRDQTIKNILTAEQYATYESMKSKASGAQTTKR
jgi:hypothetical protein